MTTQVYRVSRVLAGSSVARIDAVDADGHDLRLEVPQDLARGAAPGRLLVVQWTMHDVPGVSAETASAPTTDAASGANQARPDPTAVDQEFMEMMARGRKAATSSPPAAQGREIDRELTTILGGAGAKGKSR